MDLDSLDILIVLALAVGIIRGLTTGAVRQITSLLGTIVALVLGLEAMRPVGAAAGGLLGVGERLQPIVGFVVVFVIILIALALLVRVVEAAIRAFSLGPVNRLVGAAVGGCKAALLLSVLFLVLGFFEFPDSENRRASVLYEPVASAFPAAWNYAAARLPYMRDLSERFGEEVEAVLSDNVK